MEGWVWGGKRSEEDGVCVGGECEEYDDNVGTIGRWRGGWWFRLRVKTNGEDV